MCGHVSIVLGGACVTHEPGTSGPRTLLVAATGGHLEQLFRISGRFTPASGDVVWVTHDDAQSRSLLRDLTVHKVPYVPPRGYREVARVLPMAHRILRDGHFDRVVSTGAGVALPFFFAARARGLRCHYIESAARADGPSLTGRIVSRIPGVRLYTQYERWSTSKWNYRGSLFDRFEAAEVEPAPIKKVVVTLGTMRSYGFRRLVDQLLKVLPEVVEPEADILWQTGATPLEGIPGRVAASYPNVELRAAIADADLVVAHSGIGSALTALELGKRPVLVPRRPAFGEHVDEHQSLIARELSSRRLAVSCEADEVSVEDLRLAASGRVHTSDKQSAFALDG
jgi:UDP-N-acetylglucosamine--N-acetylmuramyl-(pentapeptide) pyrophosphoryl-undecaprenol N-acetylglucosamine transferase